MTPFIDYKVFQNLSYGLYILTSAEGEKKNGQIINTAVQVTSDPPRVSVIVNKANLTHDIILRSNIFGLSVLDAETPMTFIGLFGFRSGRDIDKLAKANFKTGFTGCPLVLDHALSVLEAELIDHVSLGTHSIFIGTVVNTEVLREGSPLTYQYYHEVLRGKSPPAAPTFDPTERPQSSRST
ncbi:MAG: flavin reductase family protein [Desulfobacteraceae bacterium]|nr:flavin reductase family protein [Desulfobacteraceae bacterium]